MMSSVATKKQVSTAEKKGAKVASGSKGHQGKHAEASINKNTVTKAGRPTFTSTNADLNVIMTAQSAQPIRRRARVKISPQFRPKKLKAAKLKYLYEKYPKDLPDEETVRVHAVVTDQRDIDSYMHFMKEEEPVPPTPLYPVGWGWNSGGRAGNLTENEIHSPKHIQRSIKHNYIACASGYKHSLLVSDEGIVYSFGEGRQGQLGYGNQFAENQHKGGIVQAIPRPITPSGEIKYGHDLKIVQVACGVSFSLAREVSLEEGVNLHRGLRKLENTLSDMKRIYHDCEPVQKAWAEVRQERFRVSVTSQGMIVSWGSGKKGELGLGPYRKYTPSAQLIPRFRNMHITQIAAGKEHCLAINSIGQLFTWGNGKFGRLGHQDFESRSAPELVTFFGAFYVEACVAGDEHSAVLITTVKGSVPRDKQIKKLSTFGKGYHGRLGNGTNLHSCVPLLVTKWLPSVRGMQIRQIACGGAHTVALLEKTISKGLANPWGVQTAVVGFGYGRNGQLGNGYTEDCFVPIKARLPKCEVIAEISAGRTWTAARTIGGILYTWGKGLRGELGLGQRIKFSLVPQRTDCFSSFIRISSGTAHNVCITVPKKVMSEKISLENILKDNAAPKEKSKKVTEEVVRFVPYVPPDAKRFFTRKEKDQQDLKDKEKEKERDKADKDKQGSKADSKTKRLAPGGVIVLGAAAAAAVKKEVKEKPLSLSLDAPLIEEDDDIDGDGEGKRKSDAYSKPVVPTSVEEAQMLTAALMPANFLPESEKIFEDIVPITLRQQNCESTYAFHCCRRNIHPMHAELRFVCKECELFSICYVCAKLCHRGHTLVDRRLIIERQEDIAEEKRIEAERKRHARAKRRIRPAVIDEEQEDETDGDDDEDSDEVVRDDGNKINKNKDLGAINESEEEEDDDKEDDAEDGGMGYRRAGKSTRVLACRCGLFNKDCRLLPTIMEAHDENTGDVGSIYRVSAMQIQRVARKYIARYRARVAAEELSNLRKEAANKHYFRYILQPIWNKFFRSSASYREQVERDEMAIEDDLKHKFDYNYNLQISLATMDAMMYGLRKLLSKCSTMVARVKDGSSTDAIRPTFSFTWYSARQLQLKMHHVRRVSPAVLAEATRYVPRYDPKEGCLPDRDVELLTRPYFRDVPSERIRDERIAVLKAERETRRKRAERALAFLMNQKAEKAFLFKKADALLRGGLPPPPPGPPPLEVQRQQRLDEKERIRYEEEAEIQATEDAEDAPFDQYNPPLRETIKRRHSICDPTRLYYRVTEMRRSIQLRNYAHRRNSLPNLLSPMHPNERVTQPYVEGVKRSLSLYPLRLLLLNGFNDRKFDSMWASVSGNVRRRRMVKTLSYSWLNPRLPREMLQLIDNAGRRRTIAEPERLAKQLKIMFETREQFAQLRTRARRAEKMIVRRRSFDLGEEVDFANGVSKYLGYEFEPLLKLPTVRDLQKDYANMVESMARAGIDPTAVDDPKDASKLTEGLGARDAMEAAAANASSGNNKGVPKTARSKASQLLREAQMSGGGSGMMTSRGGAAGNQTSRGGAGLMSARNRYKPENDEEKNSGNAAAEDTGGDGAAGSTSGTATSRRGYRTSRRGSFNGALTSRAAAGGGDSAQLGSNSGGGGQQMTSRSGTSTARGGVATGDSATTNRKKVSTTGQDGATVAAAGDDASSSSIASITDYDYSTTQEGAYSTTEGTAASPYSGDDVQVWQEHYNEAGQTYYYNSYTGESSWDLPRGPGVQMCNQYQDGSGNWYWYNSTTGESSWV